MTFRDSAVWIHLPERSAEHSCFPFLLELTQLERILMWEGEGVECDVKKFSRRGRWRL